jgi:hypothetical protein
MIVMTTPDEVVVVDMMIITDAITMIEEEEGEIMIMTIEEEEGVGHTVDRGRGSWKGKEVNKYQWQGSIVLYFDSSLYLKTYCGGGRRK